jgi:spore coat polysaccharide biosynthesis protein SpsF
VKTAVMLQARLHSVRLPRKALLPLNGGNVLQHTMRALHGVPAELHALLTDPQSAGVFAPLAQAEGFALFVGPAEDVLARYGQGARHFGADRVVRATGDNPLVSARQAALLLRLHARKRLQLSHFLGNPLGTGVEVVESAALEEAERRASDPYEREHITTYLYRHRERFRVGELRCPRRWRFPQGKVTLDTPEDYALLQRIFAELYRGRPVETEELVAWLRRHVRAGDPA